MGGRACILGSFFTASIKNGVLTADASPLAAVPVSAPVTHLARAVSAPRGCVNKRRGGTRRIRGARCARVGPRRRLTRGKRIAGQCRSPAAAVGRAAEGTAAENTHLFPKYRSALASGVYTALEYGHAAGR